MAKQPYQDIVDRKKNSKGEWLESLECGHVFTPNNPMKKWDRTRRRCAKCPATGAVKAKATKKAKLIAKPVAKPKAVRVEKTTTKARVAKKEATAKAESKSRTPRAAARKPSLVELAGAVATA